MMAKQLPRRVNCIHCGNWVVRTTARKGLCCHCYRRTDVSSQYGPISYCGRRGPLTPDLGILPLPDEPTNALPGTLKKLEVMMQRLAAKRHLHHPGDAKEN